MTYTKSLNLRFTIRAIAIFCALFAARDAAADYVTYTDSTLDDNWNDPANWHSYYGNGPGVPGSGDNAIFSTQTIDMFVAFGQPNSTPGQIYITTNGDGYTIGDPRDTTDGLLMNDYSGIYQQVNLVGEDPGRGVLGTHIDAPITANGRLFIANYSPSAATDAQAEAIAAEIGAAGDNNTMYLNGTITGATNGSYILLTGIGDIDLAGDYTATGYGLQSEMYGDATTTISGTNTNNSPITIGGNAVFDYTTNNTAKFGSAAAFQTGYNGDGGHSLFIANQSAETDITMGTAVTTFTQDGNGVENGVNISASGQTAIRYSNSITVQGATDTTIPTNVNLGFLYNYQAGDVLDLTAEGSNVNFYTNSTNNGQYGAQINILGQYVTYDKTYWAQANGNELAYQYSVTDPNTGNTYQTYGQSSTPLLITPLVNDDGDAFNNAYGNFTMDAGGESINSAMLAANGQQEGADTIRLDTAGTLDLGAGTTYTVDSTTTTGTGYLQMIYGGIMVTQGVTGDTYITNGSIANDRNLFGLSVMNYGTGTLHLDANLVSSDYVGATDEVGFNAGKIELGGNNSALYAGSSIEINSAQITLGNALALGTDNQISFGDATSTLDLNGNSVSISRLNSNNDYLPGNAAAVAGLNSYITNSKAGTISTLTIEGYAGSQYNTSDTNTHTTDLYGDVTLGQYTGGLVDGNGAILALNFQQGSATTQQQFLLGTANPIGDQSGANSSNVSGIVGPATNFIGSVTVGQGFNLGLIGYGNIETMGVTDILGNMGTDGQQAANYGTTYLTGTGTLVPGYAGGWGFGITAVGSAPDVFAGQFGTASEGTSFQPQIGGTGTVQFTNWSYSNGLSVSQDATFILPGLANNNINEYGNAKVILNGTGGQELGNGTLNIYNNSVLDVAPSGSGADVTVSGSFNTIQFAGDPTVVLDAGANNSLTMEWGNTGSSFNFNGYNEDQALTIAVAQGLSALGTTDKFVVLSNGTMNSSFYGQAFYNSNGAIVSDTVFAQDDSADSTKNATFLSYSGTGAASDTGFVAYTFGSSFVDNLNNLDSNANYGSIDKIDTNYVLSSSIYGIYALEIDNGATLDVTGGMNVGDDNYGSGGIILNGGSITGNGIAIDRFTSIYTSLANGSISSLSEDYDNQDIAKDGPGTLYIGNLTGTGRIWINQGVLDTTWGSYGTVFLDGGVLQTSGNLSLQLSNTNDGINLSTGGFAARTANLFLTLTDANGSKNLVWGVGGTANFLGEGGVLMLGSNTDDHSVLFQSNINLGLPEGGNSGQSALYSRVIEVDNNTTLDAGIADPLNYVDYAAINGTISATDPYVGLTKTGTGTLALNGANTYTGATMISAGTLVIQNDGSLGTAPTAAYALNTAPGVSGGALTPGAIEINGGAALENALDGTLVLNANRQMLLASGTDGSDPSQIYVSTILGTSEIDFGGMIADYVGEVGSLEKNGGGTFNYSGTSLNTGTDSVVQGTFEVSGGGNINSVAGVTIDNTGANSNARFNYASTAALTQTVSYGANGGTFSYNSAAAYTGATAMTIGAKQVIGGGGNLGLTNLTIGGGGTILPGNTDAASGLAQVGTLTTGHVALLAGGNYNFLLADMLGAAGTGYSTVNSGPVDLTGLDPSNPFSINIETLAGDIPGHPTNLDGLGNYQVIDFVLFDTGTADGVTALTQDQLDADFAIYTLPNNGATGFDPGPGTWEVTENADDSQLLLEYTAVPEPGTWALLLGGLGLLAFIRRARKLNS